MDPEQEGVQEEVDEFLKDANIHGVKEAQALTNQEVAILLERYQTTNTQAQPGFCPPPMVAKTQAYLDRVIAGAGRNEEAAQAVRDRLIEHGIEGVEMALLANLIPETAEEAYALIPSLKRKDGLSRQDLDALLEELQSYRTYH
ncbi:DNA-directed RNA polymerase II subunit RPB4 [Raphidocelis subcapitata]|uniref:DNA-directed RNA polymerase II subunit RPB4 n=1 Tax=Raphidocelis subcapitata TaxID=307507 RepID=A0A2V0NJW6_9CHLO|nr:DNA-directed RNA polymerase II subunit RPB4 [Raphidocelis subcapitata]|eukprot:GBF87558.1 DNA-directed RNA polymerase II subunit RPB4 [Raphidocelis subcapitata]